MVNGTAHPYKFGGKEHNQELGLDWYDFGARNYDASLGRWMNIDPLADGLHEYSPYVYAINNPLIYIDPDGQWPIKFSVRAFAPSGAFKGYGFHDDGRSFSTSDKVTSRVSHEFMVDATAQTHSSQDPVSHPTIKTESGKSKTGSPDGNVDVNYGDVGQANISQDFEGSNPFYYGLAPDIEVQTEISVLEDVDAGTITIEATGTGKQFPATESFATDSAGNSVFVGVGAAYGEPSDLLTSSKKNSIFKTTLKINVNSDGVFQSVNYKGTDYSLKDYNKLFTSQEEGPLERDKRPKN